MGALAALVVAQHHQIARSLSEVSRAKPKAILGAVGLEWMSMLAFVRVQRRLLRAGNLRLTIKSIIAITFAGNALSVSVPIAGPGLGAAFTYREFVRRDVSRAAATFVPMVSGILSTVSFTVIVAVGALVSGETVAGALGLLGAAAIAVGITAVLLAPRIPAFRRLIHRAAVWTLRLVQSARRKPGQSPEVVVASARRQHLSLHLRRRDWVIAASLAFVNWLADAACLLLSIKATRVHLPIRDLLLVWSAGSAAGSFGLTPGGLGVVEVTLVSALVGFKVPAAGAAVAVLIYRLISLWLVLLVGWVTFILLRARKPRLSAPSTQPRPADQEIVV